MTERRPLEEPLFVVGVGRSGSSVFHEILTEHPQVAWLSELCERFPARPFRNRALLQALAIPGLGRLLRRKFPPSEAYSFWDHLMPGFSVPFRDLRADDVSVRVEERIKETFGRLVTAQRDRLVVKITGWPRLGFLASIFEDARFVHIVRDGRAVANSLLQVAWWWGWRGPPLWRLGPLPEAYRREWEDHDRSFVALAAIEWKLVIDAMEEARASLPPDRVMDLRFEDLCGDQAGEIRRVTEWAGLGWSADFSRAIGRYDVRNTNEKWRRQLSAEQQQVLKTVLAGHLERYGYF